MKHITEESLLGVKKEFFPIDYENMCWTLNVLCPRNFSLRHLGTATLKHYSEHKHWQHCLKGLKKRKGEGEDEVGRVNWGTRLKGWADWGTLVEDQESCTEKHLCCPFIKILLPWSRKYATAPISFPESTTAWQVESAEWHVKCVFREQNGYYSLPDEIQASLAEVVG